MKTVSLALSLSISVLCGWLLMPSDYSLIPTADSEQLLALSAFAIAAGGSLIYARFWPLVLVCVLFGFCFGANLQSVPAHRYTYVYSSVFMILFIWKPAVIGCIIGTIPAIRQNIKQRKALLNARPEH